MTDKRFRSAEEITIDLSELSIDIMDYFVPINALEDYINIKIDYYEELRSKTDGNNWVSATSHLDMLLQLKDWLEKQEYKKGG